MVFKLTKFGFHDICLSYGSLNNFLKSKKISNPTINDVSDAVINIRKSKLPDPAIENNAGSFFKNPIVSSDKYFQLKKINEEIPCHKYDESRVKLSAAWLIEQSGWAKYVSCGARVSEKHPLVLVRLNDGNGEDVYSLSLKIKKDVVNRWGVELEPEVKIL